MTNLDALRREFPDFPSSSPNVTDYYRWQGVSAHLDDPSPITAAHGVAALLTELPPHVYPHDLIAGSIFGCFDSSGAIHPADLAHAKSLLTSFGRRDFITNADHFAPDYATFLEDGIPGTLSKIQSSMERADEAGLEFLEAAQITMTAFGQMAAQYGEEALRMARQADNPTQKENLLRLGARCQKLAIKKPETFAEALQLTWLVHTAFVYEGRYAMALGRMDQYLYPYYARDLADGVLTSEEAEELLACTFLKIGEYRLHGADDVVNIAIAGRRRDGSGGVNPLSYCILEAVRRCNIPGPNLSARLYAGIEPAFLDACLEVIGTGLGYPALMNDEVNIPALSAYGYALEDCRDYCMVGCIENFLAGKQPPWSDGRYNTPKYLELALNDGRCMLTDAQMGPHTGDPANYSSMEDVMAAFQAQMAYGAAEYMAQFRNHNDRYNRAQYTQPFLSCFCRCCIERGRDINDGGALYPSAHGVGVMGISTVADSLAAIEKAVYLDRRCTIDDLRRALLADFAGYEELRTYLLSAPKYGNNEDFVDKYAVWFVDCLHSLFSRYHTPDGGGIYIAMASNTSNIPAGEEVAATPDGRNAGQPLSDAASPMRGMDRGGPTAALLSVSKPAYTKAACGTVINQKYSPEMFSNQENRAKLASLIRQYFKLGGQELQINSVSRETLQDAMEHPAGYENLVVRVSGFSAFYTQLNRRVQRDILQRTEHG